MEIYLIAAIGTDREIGLNNKLLWHIKEDFRWFRNITLGKPVIMGRATYESIGRPLPGRINIVLSKDVTFKPDPRVTVRESVAAALSQLSKHPEVFVIGGEQIYKQFLPHAHRLYLTEIDKSFEADAFFPEFPEEDYMEFYSRKGIEDVGFEYHFKVYVKKLK